MSGSPICQVFRALRVFPRTGAVIVWNKPALVDVDRLVTALTEAPPPGVPALVGLRRLLSAGPLGPRRDRPASSARSPSSPDCRPSAAPHAPSAADATREPICRTTATVISLVPPRTWSPLTGNDLRQVAAVVELGRHTLRVVRQNYTLSIGVNLVGLIAGAGGSVDPVLAALLHTTSSIVVEANARLVGHTPHLPSDTTARLRAAPLEERRVR
jgi:cation-transporting P-type ATPase C